MDITLDRSSPVPLYRQIADQLAGMISSSSLPGGFRLPPERRLAEALGVNRSTVLSAYQELKAAGLADAHVGRGTTVAGPRHLPVPRSGSRLSWDPLFRLGSGQDEDPRIRDLLELTERHDVISMAVGLPAPELLPLQTLKSLTVQVMDEHGPQVLGHSPTEGHTPLRETLARWATGRGICCTPSEVLVLSGSQQGIDLASRVLVDPGAAVIVEEPSYIGALHTLRAAGARLLSVPVDGEGMRTDLLARLLSLHRVRLIYTLPTFQNPSGTVMSLARRHQLLDLAYQHQVPVIEDDPYSELRYTDGDPLPSLKALDRLGHVLYLSTFSKLLFPGMRLGFLVAPRPVVRRLVLAKQCIDLHSNTLGQHLLDRFIREGHYGPHLQVVRAAYARRRDAMEAALRRHAPPGFSWATPSGGFYFWCRLPEGSSPRRLLTLAAEAGVSYLPGWSCSAGGEPTSDFIRLNFSCLTPEQIDTGVARLMGAIRQMQALAPMMIRAEVGTAPIV